MQVHVWSPNSNRRPIGPIPPDESYCIRGPARGPLGARSLKGDWYARTVLALATCHFPIDWPALSGKEANLLPSTHTSPHYSRTASARPSRLACSYQLSLLTVNSRTCGICSSDFHRERDRIHSIINQQHSCPVGTTSLMGFGECTKVGDAVEWGLYFSWRMADGDDAWR